MGHLCIVDRPYKRSEVVLISTSHPRNDGRSVVPVSVNAQMHCLTGFVGIITGGRALLSANVERTLHRLVAENEGVGRFLLMPTSTDGSMSTVVATQRVRERSSPCATCTLPVRCDNSRMAN